MAENEELKSFLVRVKEESEKAGLKLKRKKKNLTIQSPHFMANIKGKSGSSDRFPTVPWAPKSLCMVTAATKLKDTCSLEVKL